MRIVNRFFSKRHGSTASIYRCMETNGTSQGFYCCDICSCAVDKWQRQLLKTLLAASNHQSDNADQSR